MYIEVLHCLGGYTYIPQATHCTAVTGQRVGLLGGCYNSLHWHAITGAVDTSEVRNRRKSSRRDSK